MPWPQPDDALAPTCSNFSPGLSILNLIRSTPSGGVQRLRLRLGFWLIAWPGRRHDRRAMSVALPPTLVFQEGIVLALLADRSLRAVAGNDDGVIREGKELVVQGVDDLLKRAAGKIGSTDASR